jgi:hypothetical protein
VRDVSGQPRLAERQHVGDTRGAQQDECGVRRPDAGELLQVGERRRWLHRREQSGLEGTVEGGTGDRVQPRHPVGSDAADRVGGQQLAGERERVHLLAADRERAPQFGADPVADHRRLRAVPPGADDRPGGGLIGGVEQYRPQPLVLALQSANHRVAHADLRPRCSVVVERQDPPDLPRRGVGVPVGVDGDRDGPAGNLRQPNPGVVPHVVGDERQPHLVPRRLRARHSGPEPEPGGRCQRERPIRLDGACSELHVTDIALGSDIPCLAALQAV